MKALTFAVVSDLYLAGRTEDGLDYTAEVYFVQAEDAQGNRWNHRARFVGCKVHHDDEGFGYVHFEDIRDDAKAQADRLLARIHAARGAINLAHWDEARPAYGSAAYQDYGQYNDWMEEQQERMGLR